MSKAEEFAYSKYPKSKEGVLYDLARNSIIQGYDRAEKDMELTWEDINTIIGLYNDLDDKTLCNPKRACKEILKQFKERKEV